MATASKKNEKTPLLEISKLPQLTIEELLATEHATLSGLDTKTLEQIAESAAIAAEEFAKDKATRVYTLSLTADNVKHAKAGFALLTTGQYDISAKTAAAIVVATGILNSIQNRKAGDTLDVTADEYSFMLFAFGTTFKGNTHTAQTLINVFNIFEEISKMMQEDNTSQQYMELLYNASTDIVADRDDKTIGEVTQIA